MKKRNALLMILGILLLIAVYTNPDNREEYVSWIANQMKRENIVIGFLAKPIIDAATTKQNYVLFSIYKTELSEKDILVTIGVLDRYIPIENKKPVNK